MYDVLLACEESQAVCKAFRELGYSAYSCDILPCSGGHPEWHIQDDVLKILHLGWKMMIAFPPCTHLSVSGAAWFKEKRKDGRQQAAIDFFMALARADIDMIAIENPVGVMSSIYRKPNQIIQPYYFGDSFQKKTCLWLKNLPRLNGTNVVESGEKMRVVRKDGRVEMCAKWNMGLGPSEDRGQIRSKTFPGIAHAMATQWGRLL